MEIFGEVESRRVEQGEEQVLIDGQWHSARQLAELSKLFGLQPSTNPPPRVACEQGQDGRSPQSAAATNRETAPAAE